jgi:hypothetical protein
VSSLIISGILGLMEALLWWVFLGIAVMYAITNLIASSQITWREKDFRYFVILPLLFMVLHVSYGLGSVWGSLKLLTAPDFWKKLLGKSGGHSAIQE